MVPGANAASIMDRLRVKQYRPWNDISRLLRQLSGEKHLFVDAEERGQLQRCLDLLQKSIKINSAQGMIERLDTITRQLGLKLTKDQKRSAERKPVELFEVFISSDMFYVEVVVESNGHVCDVKVAHHGDPVSCPELCRVLQENDFVTFTAHLQGLIAIYQLNCEKSRKQKAYVALQALESDLSTVAALQKFLNDPRQLVCKSPVGILQKRRGGFPMQLTFFVSPYDLIDQTKSAGSPSGSMTPFTVENVLNRKLGQSVSISIENSGQHKLQTGSLITNSDSKMPNFGPLTQLNSVSLPACFTMKLATAMPLDTECIKKIQKVTGIEIPGSQTTSPLIELITGRNQGAYFVKLPDQDHTYHMNGGQRKGSMVTSIPFTHPTHVPPVLEYLRQQSLFNALISSCVRDQPCAAPQSHVFEVQASSLTSLCVSFEHPLDNESLITLEISLVDILGLKCKAYFCSQQSELNQFLNEEAAARVLQLSFSIPVLMRSILKKAKAGSTNPLDELQSKAVATPSFLPGGPSSDAIKRDHFDANNVPNFGDSNGPGSMQQDLFDLESIGSLQGGLSLNMLADDGPTALVGGRQNPYQQQGTAPNGSGGPGSQLQRKRPREDGDFLDNRPPGFPLGAAGGPTLKGQLENINNNSGDSNQQPQLLSSTIKSVGDQLESQIKRQRTDGPMEDGGMSLTASTGRLNNIARDSKNLQAGGDSGESPPAKISNIPSNATAGPGAIAGGGNASSGVGGTTGGVGSSANSGTGSGSSSSHGVSASSGSGSQQSSSRKEKSSSSSGGTSSKSDDKRNSSSSSSSSRDKEKRKEKDKSYSKDGSSKSSSSKSSSSKDKDHKTSSKSSSSKDKSSSSSRGSSSSGLNAIGEKVQQSGVPMAKFASLEMASGSNASPSKYGSSSSSSSEGQQFTVKSSSSAQGIKLTINKARTSEGGTGSSSRSGGSSSSGTATGSGSGGGSASGGSKSSTSSSSSSKHNRDSPKPRSLSSSPSHKTSKASPSWKSSPKHSSSSSSGTANSSASATIMPPPADVNSSVDLVEQRLRALHGDDSPGLIVSAGVGSVGVGPPSTGSPFDSRSPLGTMGPPSAGSSSLSSVSRPSPVVIDDELMDEALCGMKNHV